MGRILIPEHVRRRAEEEDKQRRLADEARRSIVVLDCPTHGIIEPHNPFYDETEEHETAKRCPCCHEWHRLHVLTLPIAMFPRAKDKTDDGPNDT